MYVHSIFLPPGSHSFEPVWDQWIHNLGHEILLCEFYFKIILAYHYLMMLELAFYYNLGLEVASWLWTLRQNYTLEKVKKTCSSFDLLAPVLYLSICVEILLFANLENLELKTAPGLKVVSLLWAPRLDGFIQPSQWLMRKTPRFFINLKLWK